MAKKTARTKAKTTRAKKKSAPSRSSRKTARGAGKAARKARKAPPSKTRKKAKKTSAAKRASATKKARKAVKKRPAAKKTKKAKAAKKAARPARSSRKKARASAKPPRAGKKTVAKKAARPVKSSRKRPKPPAKPPRAGKKTVARKTTPRKRAASTGIAKSKPRKAGKRSKGVERLLAIREQAKDRPRKQDFLIKAPKKAKQASLATPARFTRRLTAPEPVREGPKPTTRQRKAVLRKRIVDELRQALDLERQRLIAQLAALDEAASLKGPSEVNEDIPGYSIHLAEYASDNQVVETTLAQRALQAERLAEIEQALKRIGQPGYGICQSCGSTISVERLKIKPFASFCVRCRELKERGLL